VSLDGTVHLPVSLAKPAPPAGVTISFTSSDTSKATVTPSVFIASGKTSPNVQPLVTGVDVGTVSISATSLGYTPSTQPVQVTATIAFARCCATIIHQTTASFTVTLSSPAPAGGLTIQLTSGNTGVATAPGTVTFPPNATSVNVPITGVAAGTATVQASALNLAATSIKVTVQ
jgi:hypothetical protein